MGKGFNIGYYFCSSGEYNTTTGVPTVSNPDANILYLVPSISNDNEINIYNYKNNSWVLFNTVFLEPENFVVDDTLSNSG